MDHFSNPIVWILPLVLSVLSYSSSIYRLSRSERNPLQAAYNSHILHSPTTDPFKLALFKIIGKLDPARRAVPLVTTTTEDWLWFQLAMLDEEENGGLRMLSDVLMGYGERHFEGTAKGKRGMWARVLLVCGQFERVSP
jgi:nuclear pore complex protein Nup93